MSHDKKKYNFHISSNYTQKKYRNLYKPFKVFCFVLNIITDNKQNFRKRQ